MICHDCPHGPSTVTRLSCCDGKARKRDAAEMRIESRYAEAVRSIAPDRPTNRAERRRQAAMRRKG